MNCLFTRIRYNNIALKKSHKSTKTNNWLQGKSGIIDLSLTEVSPYTSSNPSRVCKL